MTEQCNELKKAIEHAIHNGKSKEFTDNALAKRLTNSGNNKKPSHSDKKNAKSDPSSSEN